MRTLSLFFLLTSAIIVNAQTFQTIRHVYGKDEERHQVIPVPGTDRAILIFDKKIPKSKDYIISISLLDKDLKTLKQTELNFGEFINPLHFVSTDKIYFYDDLYKKETFLLYVLDISSFKESRQTGFMQKDTYINDIQVLNGNVFLAGSDDDNACMVVLNPVSNSVKRICAKDQTKEKLEYAGAQQINNQEIVFKYTVFQKYLYEYRLWTFNDKGEQSASIYVLPNPDEETGIVDFKLYKAEANAYIVAGTVTINGQYDASGTYITKNVYLSRWDAGNDSRNASNGFFFARFSNHKYDFLNTYNFLDISNFTTHLSQKEQDRIKSKRERNEEAGKKIYTNRTTLVHDVLESEDGYVLVGEFFELLTHSTKSSSTGQVFAGYHYTHATIIQLDKRGNIRWSNSVPMLFKHVKHLTPEFIHCSLENGTLNLAFPAEDSIRYYSFKKDIVVKQECVVIPITGDGADGFVNSFPTNFYWYGRNCINCRVNNHVNESGRKEGRVFCVSRVPY